MCDPMVGMLVSAGSALINYQQQQDVMSQQQAANDAWVAYQQQAQQKELAADEAARQKAEAARQTSLTDVNAAAQKTQQATEQQRLTDYLTPKGIKQQGTDGSTDPNATPGDLWLSGQQNATPSVQSAIAGQLNQAAQDARSRIAALATMQSYGGSQFGLQPTVNQAFQTSGQQIALQGDIRQGDLAVLQAERNVQPLHIVASPSPWGGIASSLAGIAGKGFGGGGGTGIV